MANLYGTGCARCNKEVAAARKEMPHMDGYLDTDDYINRYKHLPEGTWPKPYVDGVYIEHAIATVCGEDGWVLAVWDDLICACGSDYVAYNLWRGTVELR